MLYYLNLMKTSRVIVLIFFQLTIGYISAAAQERYREAIFDPVTIETYTYASRNGQNLDMDIYLPAFHTDEQFNFCNL